MNALLSLDLLDRDYYYDVWQNGTRVDKRITKANGTLRGQTFTLRTLLVGFVTYGAPDRC